MEWAEKEIRDYLVELYWEDKKSLSEIAKEIDIPISTLWELFYQYRIKARTIIK